MSKTMCQLLKTFRNKREENEHDQAANENMVHGEIWQTAVKAALWKNTCLICMKNTFFLKMYLEDFYMPQLDIPFFVHYNIRYLFTSGFMQLFVFYYIERIKSETAFGQV